MKSILLLCILPICLSHHLCDYSHYWSNEKETCLPCSKCPNHQITVKPCQAHQNTICKSVSKFDLPWKKEHHKATIHFETDNVDDYDDDIYKDIFSKHMDPSGKPLKHSRNFEKQRINDKFLSWDDDKKSQKHKKHYEFKGSKHQKFDIFNDEDEDTKYRGNNHKKNVHRVKLEDEDILKQWLIQSKKQFKIKKDKMLKNLKEEKDGDDGDEWDYSNYNDDWEDDDDDTDFNSDDWDDDYSDEDDDPQEKKIKLNYPLHKNDKKMENSHRSPKRKEAKQLSDIDEDLFKDLIKNEDGDLDVSTLLSNKREFAYKSSPSVLGKPSISEIIGQVKDPQELIKQGRNVIYEKSKISVMPISKEINDADVISVPFTAAERFVWDWQALALCSALFACLVFFIVVISYTILNARQWKRVKRNYSTELEEMSTKIALMQPTLEAVIAENPTKIESTQKH